jgi:hypothetical protein
LIVRVRVVNDHDVLVDLGVRLLVEGARHGAHGEEEGARGELDDTLEDVREGLGVDLDGRDGRGDHRGGCVGGRGRGVHTVVGVEHGGGWGGAHDTGVGVKVGGKVRKEEWKEERW